MLSSPSHGTNAFEVVISFADNALMSPVMAAERMWTLHWMGHRTTHSVSGGLSLFANFCHIRPVLCFPQRVVRAELSVAVSVLLHAACP